MILINLLPDEYRQKKRTPVKYFGLITASVAVNASLLAFLAWTAFGIAAEVSSELAVLEDNRDGLAPQVQYHKSLEAESAVFSAREKTLGEITRKRVSWTEQIDGLVDVINEGGDQEKYLIWLDNLRVTQTDGARGQNFGSLTAGAHSGTASLVNVTSFLRDIEESPMVRLFKDPAPPTGSRQVQAEDLQPAEIWDFPLSLDLKSPEERGQQ